jgi:hypothetical protein
MVEKRQAAGFKRLGETGVRGLPLPIPRARALALEAAWRAAAGPSIARRAIVRRLARGVLEVDVAEAPWRSALVRLLPEIEARLRERYPALAIERVQLMED